MIKRIIYFVLGPFSERDYTRFGIDVFEGNGFHVEVWDFTPFLYPKVHENLKISDPINYSKLRVFEKSGEALHAISGLNGLDSFVICFVPYGINTYSIYRTLSMNKIKYSVFMANAMPLTACSSYRMRDIVKKISLKEVIDKLCSLTFKKILEILFFKIDLNVLRIEPATLRFVGGDKSDVTTKYPVNDKTETLWLHTLDYDIYLKEKQKPRVAEERLGVFLDEDMAFHPAYLYLGVKPFVMPNDYFRLLCTFFKHLEDQYKMRIIIAAHPRSNYGNNPDYFKGRSVIKGKTAEFIQSSSFVIAHASTSINYAVLFKKPIIFVTTNELDKSPEGVWIHNIASFFNKSVYNLNKIDGIDLAGELTVNHTLYDNYKNDYIKKTGSEELAFWQIVAQRIKET